MDKASTVIAVTSVSDYNQEKVNRAISRHFEMLGLAEKLSPDMNVVIKPNLLMKRNPKDATTTHPAIVRGIILKLHELGVHKITVAESPGGTYTAVALNGIYTECGMKEAVKGYAALNSNFESDERKTPNGKPLSSFTIIKPILEADFIINVAKLKTHAMTGMSGAVKNLFGTIPGLMKPELHWRFPDKRKFCEMLVELCETVNPDVCFIDAVTSMEGDGPSSGIPKQTEMIISGYNPYNIDLALCRVISAPPESIYTVDTAIKLNYSEASADKLDFIGDELHCFNFVKPKGKSTSFEDYVPKLLKRPAKAVMNSLFTPRPHIITKTCVGCGKCAESCPAGTITIKDRKAIIDYSKCIKCFCCHEMCPIKSISIKRLKVFNI